MDPFESHLARWSHRAERALDACLPADETFPPTLHAAMRYSVLGGGKRLRPCLVYACGEALDAPPEALDAAAVAVELIHAYSLIHDDLPAMDDDDLRRGKPTCHKVYGEAMAILAGDALQALAFEILCEAPAPSHVDRAAMAALLARACGSRGMAGGQVIDLAAVGRSLSLAEIETMHRHKTGALIQASVLLGALSAGLVEGAVHAQLAIYGHEIGLAFQIQDDLLDVLGETSVIGKTQGADMARGKPTYPSVIGIEASRELARIHLQRALDALSGLGLEAEGLRTLARYVVERQS